MGVDLFSSPFDCCHFGIAMLDLEIFLFATCQVWCLQASSEVDLRVRRDLGSARWHHVNILSFPRPSQDFPPFVTLAQSHMHAAPSARLKYFQRLLRLRSGLVIAPQ